MRNVVSLNENWTLTFPKGERPAEAVTLPHTWNAVDGKSPVLLWFVVRNVLL